MPIKHKTIIKFGTGEISVGVGLARNKDGFVSFNTQKARPVGSIGEPQRFNDVPIILEFTNVESLDALMKQLSVARNLMTGENVTKGVNS